MYADRVITCLIKSPEEMGRLGNLFGSLFLDPLLHKEDNSSRSVVVSLLGAKKSGKTYFAERSSVCLNDPSVKLSEWRNRFPLAKEKDGQLFRYVDLGPFNYPLDKYGNPCGSIQRLESSMRNDCFFEVRARFEKPGLDIIEHPSFPHLLYSHVIVLVGNASRPHERKCSDNYFETMEKIIFSLLHPCSSGLKGIAHKALALIGKRTGEELTGRAGMVESTALPQMRTVRNLTTSPEHGAHGRSSKRYVSIALMSPKPPHRAAFDTFKREASAFALS